FELAPEAILTVIGYQADEVEAAVRAEAGRLGDRNPDLKPQLFFSRQAEQRGTGHAVMAAREQLAGRKGPVIVVAGDVPMIQSSTLRNLTKTHRDNENKATLLTVEMDDPTGYGRIIRDDEGQFVHSVEEKDASPEQRAVREVNVSVYCFEIQELLA